MNKNRSVNISTQYNEYCQRHHKINSKQNQPQNIFNEDELKLQGKSQATLSFTKLYEVVGLKQLKHYEGRCKKSKRNTLRKPTAQMNRKLNSKSSHRHPHSLLNKRQVLEALPAINRVESQQRMKKVKGSLWMTELSDIGNPSFEYSKIKEDLRPEIEFSISKVNASLKEQKEQWERFAEKVNRKDSKFPAIFTRVEAYRSTVQERQKNSILFSLPQQNSQKWSSILRTERKVKQMGRKPQIPHTFHGGQDFLAKGNSKLRTEREWLSQKENSGYNFKLLKEGNDSVSSVTSRR